MKKVLIASVGGSPEPIVNAIVNEEPPFGFFYFLCSSGKAGSDETVQKAIVPAAQLVEGSYAVEHAQSPHDLTDVVNACARIEADLEARFAGEELEVMVNYTGGTRTMSAGLVALAQRRGWTARWSELPERRWCGPVSRVSLTGVSVFSSLEIACSQGINVIIGENGTGKTHVLKCMYALLRAAEEAEGRLPSGTDRGDKLERVLGGRARSLFAAEEEPCRVYVECGNERFERGEVAGEVATWSLPKWVRVRVRALFFPSREVLAMYRGFRKAYEEREISFDETYYDFCGELDREQLREPPPEFAAVLAQLEGILGGPVRLEIGGFVVVTPRAPIPAPMVAEGHRKLATLAYLIKNGALSPESVLFWDEPEANLNPKLVREIARVIRTLGKAGVQIFVATHDYLLARELSMEAEYQPEDVDTQFFALHRTSGDGPVEVESGAYWSDLRHNPIFEAYAAHHDREQDLFAGISPEEQA